jgi:hypothetical protein
MLHTHFLWGPTEKDILIEISTGEATTKHTLKRYWSDQTSIFFFKNECTASMVFTSVYRRILYSIEYVYIRTDLDQYFHMRI